MKKDKQVITFVFVSGRKDKYYRNNYEALDFFYTLPFYDNNDFELNIIEFKTGEILKKNLTYYTDRVFNKFLSLPFYMHKIVSAENFKILKKSDHVFLISESAAFSLLPLLGLVKMFKKTNFHLFAMGLFSKKVGYSILRPLHFLMIKLLILSLDNLFFLGKGELEFAKSKNRFTKKLHFVPFSIDTSFWSINSDTNFQKRKKIIFVGNDSNRDFIMVKEIAKIMSDINFLIVSKNPLFNNLNLKNVEILGNGWGSDELSDYDLKKLYLESFLTIIPLKSTYQPSGQSVALQSMSLGTPVMISKTSGFWDDSSFFDNENIFFIEEEEEVSAWVNKILKVYKDFKLLEKVSNNAKHKVINDYNLYKFDEKIKKITGLG